MPDSPPPRLGELSPEKRALLERELAKRRGRLAVPMIRPRGPDEPLLLSLAQRRLWFLDQASPGRATYNATLTMRLVGDLDVAALRWALDEITTRHESLRTVGINVGGQPRAELLDAGVRWRHVRLQADETDLSERLAADAREPFDLSRDVMLRAALYTVSTREHVLILVLHHMASDGWSRGVLFSELSALYNARVAGLPSPLTPLPIQYGDYARWEVELIESGRQEADLEFWREQLAGTDLVLNLPTDRPRPRLQEHRGNRIAMDGSPGSGDALRDLARAEGATYFMALMAASGVFLHGLTGQEDFLLGSPVANRQLPELELLIGFFVNTVLFRVRMSGDPSFRQLLRRCRETAIACLAHQQVSLDRLVEIANPKRHPGRNPLFQVNYRMQGVAPPPPQLTGVTATRLLTETGSARFDLALGYIDGPGALRGYIEYDEALFDRSTAEQWQAAMTELVDALLADPDAPLRAHRAVVEQSRDRLNAEWRRQQASRPAVRRGIRAR
jgi:hypothetical protein